MAPDASNSKQGAPQVVEGRELYNRQKHQSDNPRANRQSYVTPEQRQLIRRMYAAGKTGHEIAREMGLGSTTVYNHLALGGKKPRWSDEEDQAVIDGYAQKQSVKEIAKKIGRSEQAVILHMYWHRQKIKNDPKRRRALSAIALAFRAVKKADIFREME